MRYFIFIFLLSGITAYSQNANWGTGLPITVTIDGSYLDLEVFDPEYGQTKTTSIYVGSNPVYQNSDGVVVGYGSNGYLEFATYDLELHLWKKGDAYIGSNGSITTSDGVAVGYGSNGYLEFATYDADLQYWKKDDAYIGSNGVVATSDGVAVGYGSNGYLEFATYDIELQYWKKDDAYMGSNGVIATSGGVAAGYGSNGYVEYAIYDFNLQYWKKNDKYLGSSGSFSISNATISYSGSSSGTQGYNPSSNSWGSSPTTPSCKLLPVTFSNSDWVFMRCMSIGANSYNYSCGDGHQIYRKQGWKKYNTNNQYNVSLNVTNGTGNSTCNSTVNITSDINDEIVKPTFQIYPNPAIDKVFIDISETKEVKMEIYSVLGKRILQKQLSKKTSEIDISSLSKGMYIIKLSGDSWTEQRKLVKE